MVWVLAILAGLLALCRYLKTPRAVPLTILAVASLLVIAARFLLPPEHPVRANAGSDLDGLIVLIFAAVLGWLYLKWFRSLKPRGTRAAADPGFVLVPDDAALTRDVETLLGGARTETFSVLRRDTGGDIAASGRAAVKGPVAALGPLYAPDAGLFAELLETLEAEALSRGATEALIGPVDEADAALHQSHGYDLCASFALADGPRVLLKKALA